MSNKVADELRVIVEPLQGYYTYIREACLQAADELDRLQLTVDTLTQSIERVNEHRWSEVLEKLEGYDCQHCGMHVVIGDSMCRVTGEKHVDPKDYKGWT